MTDRPTQTSMSMNVPHGDPQPRRGRPPKGNCALPSGSVPAMTPVPLINVRGAAERLGIPPGYIYDLVKQRRLPCIRVGRYLRFSVASLQRWMDEQERDHSAGQERSGSPRALGRRP